MSGADETNEDPQKSRVKANPLKRSTSIVPMVTRSAKLRRCASSPGGSRPKGISNQEREDGSSQRSSQLLGPTRSQSSVFTPSPKRTDQDMLYEIQESTVDHRDKMMTRAALRSRQNLRFSSKHSSGLTICIPTSSEHGSNISSKSGVHTPRTPMLTTDGLTPTLDLSHLIRALSDTTDGSSVCSGSTNNRNGRKGICMRCLPIRTFMSNKGRRPAQKPSCLGRCTGVSQIRGSKVNSKSGVLERVNDESKPNLRPRKIDFIS